MCLQPNIDSIAKYGEVCYMLGQLEAEIDANWASDCADTIQSYITALFVARKEEPTCQNAENVNI